MNQIVSLLLNCPFPEPRLIYFSDYILGAILFHILEGTNKSLY